MTRRIFDVIIAATLLVLLLPVVVVIAYLIHRHDGGPVLYRQQRIGYRGRLIEMLKFRSMYLNDDDSALRAQVENELNGEGVAAGGSFKLCDDPRITPIGRWLRSTSLDELPQLINVLKGDMSLVGPRPSLPWEADMFPTEYQRRTDVRPGMTGLWQVSGRSQLTTLEMLDRDVEYVDSQSFLLDLRILWRTLPAVIRGDGAR
jgi:lipopolysaccharide/colanic/teichoic acid biosynthesis glycosyltransferase